MRSDDAGAESLQEVPGNANDIMHSTTSNDTEKDSKLTHERSCHSICISDDYIMTAADLFHRQQVVPPLHPNPHPPGCAAPVCGVREKIKEDTHRYKNKKKYNIMPATDSSR